AVEEDRRRKRSKRGGFDNRVFLFSVCDEKPRTQKTPTDLGADHADRTEVVAP
ncbi:unnamed protein product, partial [marine sediment metagenome]